MSASQAPALDAIVFQLEAALEEYGRDVETMAATWLDMDLYGEVSDEVEQIRKLSAEVPQLRLHWVELFIGHAELVHSLWRQRFQDGRPEGDRLQAILERHTSCIRSLRGRCLRLIAGRHGQRA